MKYNKTIGGGEPTFLNACVGENGLQDIETYADGFRCATISIAELLISSKESHKVDCYIFQLIFNARHCIELYIKESIIRIEEIGNVPINNSINTTHDLKKLWNCLRFISIKTDRRYNDLIDQIEEYVLDFHEIDPNGQTFRYPDDKFKTPHLRQTPLINVLKFYKRFLKLCRLLKRLTSLNNELVAEYSVKTYTKSLSRYDIENISKIIPFRAKWGNDIFLDKKIKILKEYKLSNNEFSKALNIIQNHRLFCNNIGLELPLKITNSAKIIQFMNFVDSYSDSQESSAISMHSRVIDTFNTGSFLDECQQYSEYINKVSPFILNEIGLRHFADITAIYDLGRLPIYFGELYEERLHMRLKKIAKIRLYHPEKIDSEILYYLSKSNLKTGLISGLRMIGKDSIINKLQAKMNA